MCLKQTKEGVANSNSLQRGISNHWETGGTEGACSTPELLCLLKITVRLQLLEEQKVLCTVIYRYILIYICSVSFRDLLPTFIFICASWNSVNNSKSCVFWCLTGTAQGLYCGIFGNQFLIAKLWRAFIFLFFFPPLLPCVKCFCNYFKLRLMSIVERCKRREMLRSWCVGMIGKMTLQFKKRTWTWENQ